MSVWESGNDVKALRKKYYMNHTQGKPNCADLDDTKRFEGDGVTKGRYFEQIYLQLYMNASPSPPNNASIG